MTPADDPTAAAGDGPDEVHPTALSAASTTSAEPMNASQRDTQSVRPITMQTVSFTVDELREVHDALSDYVRLMIRKGQTPQELRYQSLANAWSAQQKAVSALLPGTPPAWVAARAAEVREAIERPKRRAERPWRP